jgi:DNA-binding NtrC family response regulator
MDELAATNRIALLDGDPARLARIRTWVEEQGCIAVELEPQAELGDSIDVVFYDVQRAGGFDLLRSWRASGVDIPVVLVTADRMQAREGLRAGAWDAIVDLEDRDVVEAALRRARERRVLARRVHELESQARNGHDEGVVPLRELERRAIEKALAATRGSVEKAARMLGMGRATLYRRLATMGASRPV